MMEDLGPLPVVHPRERDLHYARQMLIGSVVAICEQFKLSASEKFLLLTEELSNLAQFCVAAERRHESKRA